MKALIIGGGIGGAAAAMALQRAGHEPVVYEAHDGPGEHLGLFLGLAPNGMRMLAKLDALDAVLREDVIPTPRMSFWSSRGKRLGTVSSGFLDDGTPSPTIMRGALQRALLDEVRARGIEVRFGKRFVDFREEKGGVRVTFADGSEASGDLLVGADGIRSRVRATLDPSAPGPTYTGLINLGGVTRDDELEPTPDAMHMVWGSRAFFGYTVRDDGEVWWFSNIGLGPEPSREELTLPAEAWKERLRTLFEGDPPFLTRVIERTDVIGAFPIHDVPHLPRWRRGRAVLLGDAAHAVSPSAGQGASLALEDAVVLAGCLRDQPLDEALARYEALRRPRAERVVEAGRRRGAYKAPGSTFALVVRDALMPLAMRVFANERSLAWLYDYDVPAELERAA